MRRRGAPLSALAAAFQQVAEAVFVTDSMGAILYANRAFESVTGYSAAEAVGQTPRMLKSGHHDTEFYEDLWLTIGAGDVWKGAVVNRRKDGRLYEAEASITPVRNSAGAVTQFVAVQRDVTAVRQAQKLEALGMIVASIAHELNNPLSMLIVNLPLLEELWKDALPLLDERLRDEPERRLARLPWSAARETAPNLIAGMRRGTERIRLIISELKNFTSPDGVREERVFPVDEPLRGALELVAPEVKRVGAQLDVNVDEDLPELRGAPGKLEQVLVNLVLNALSFVPSEGGQVHVSATGLRGGEWLEIVVSDNGPGVPPELRHRLFEPFFTTRVGKGGTGLGLAISRRIVRQLGGDLFLEGEEGSRFQVILPAGARSAPIPATDSD